MIKVRDAELEASREEEAKVNRILYESEEKVRELQEQLEITQGAHERAGELEKELEAEKHSHALTREEFERTTIAKGKIAKKKENVAQMELTKVKVDEREGDDDRSCDCEGVGNTGEHRREAQ